MLSESPNTRKHKGRVVLRGDIEKDDCGAYASQCPDFWIHFSRHKRPKSWSNIKDPAVLLERNLQEHPLAGLLWERQFEEVLLGLGWEKYQIGNVCVFIENRDHTSPQQVFEHGLQSIKFSCDPPRWDVDANDNG